MSTITYFGDVISKGNTNLVQNLTAAGAFTYFAGNIWGSQSVGTAAQPFKNVFSVNANINSLTLTNFELAPGATFITSNLVVSNAFQGGNLFASQNANITTVNATTIATGTLACGLTGANLTTLGNIYTTNAFTTTNIFASNGNLVGTANVGNVFAINMGSLANLEVYGNAWISNSILTTNIFLTGNANLTTINVSTPVFLTSLNSTANTADVTGNLYVSNAVTTTNLVSANIRLTSTLNAATVNVTNFYTATAGVLTGSTINTNLTNTQSIFGTSGTVGIGTLASGPSLYVLGNVYASNALTGNIVTSTLNYVEDLNRRYIHLSPDASNATSIVQGMSATFTRTYQPTSFWSTASVPVFGNISSTGSGANLVSGYSGSVVVPDGRVVFVPEMTSNIGIYNPKTCTFSSLANSGARGGEFKGGVLLPNGNVLFVPQNSNVGMFDPLTNKFSNVTSLPVAQYNGVLTSNGVVFTPKTANSNVINYNYSTNVWSNVVSFARADSTTTISLWEGTVAPGASNRSTQWMAWSPELGLLAAIGLGGYSNLFAYSTDGAVTWTDASTPDANVNGALEMYKIIWCPQLGMFFGVGWWMARYAAYGDTTLHPTIWYSRDGKRWDPAWWNYSSPSTYSGDVNTICWSPQLGLLVATGAENSGSPSYTIYMRIWTSPDGFNWTLRTNPSTYTTNMSQLCWSPQLGIFTGGGIGFSVYSYDGLTWSDATSAKAGEHWAMAWSPELGIFVSGGRNFFNPDIAWSTDGKNWTTGSPPSDGCSARQFFSVVWSPEHSMFVAFGNKVDPNFNGGDFYGLMYYSIDGKNWVNIVGNPNYTPTSGRSLRGGVWVPELGYFFCAEDNPTNWPSPAFWRNSLTLGPVGLPGYWVVATTDAADSNYYRIIWDSANSKWAITGMGNPGSAYSTDGKNWTTSSQTIYSQIGMPLFLRGLGGPGLVFSGPGTSIIAACGEQYAFYSTNGGVTWYNWQGSHPGLIPNSEATRFNDIAYGSFYFCAVGMWSGGFFGTHTGSLFSTGYDWFTPSGPMGVKPTLADVDYYATWLSVAYDPSTDKWCAVGENGNYNSAYCTGLGWYAPSYSLGQATYDYSGQWGQSRKVIRYGVNSFVAANYDTSGVPICITSDGGVNWTVDGLGFWPGPWVSIRYSPEFLQYILIADNGYVIKGLPMVGWNSGIDSLFSNIAGSYWTDIYSNSSQTVVLSYDYDPTSHTATYYQQFLYNYVPKYKSSGSALTPTGNVVFSSPDSANVIQYNPVNLTISNTTGLGSSRSNMVLDITGNVVCLASLSNISYYNPTTRVLSNAITVSRKYNSGVTIPSGNVLLVPGADSNIGMFNPTTLTLSNLTSYMSNSAVNFSGGSLLPTGQVVFCPALSGNVGVLGMFSTVPQEVCQSPYFNKF